MERVFKFVLWTCVVVAILVGAARLTVLRWWRIPADDPYMAASITPTLRGGDLVLLWRAGAPRFGALVVCPDPEDPSLLVIGRIAGEGRDSIKIERDNVWVNDERADTEHACKQSTFEVEDPNTGSLVEQHCAVEALGGQSHMRGETSGQALRPETSRTVGEDNVFLLSDNRQYPYDSRDYGNVERSTCTESIFFRLMSAEGFFDVQSRLTYIR